MRIIVINHDEHGLGLLRRFTSNDLPTTFRYFDKRDISVIRNHKITLLGMLENEVMAYAHVDTDDDGNNWLGICVLGKYTNRGYGKRLMKELLDRASDLNVGTIKLTVDVDNDVAIRLYESFGFASDGYHNSRIMKMIRT